MGGVRHSRGPVHVTGVVPVDNPEHLERIAALELELKDARAAAERPPEVLEKLVHVDKTIEKVVPDPKVVEQLNAAHRELAHLKGMLRDGPARVVEKIVEKPVEKVVEKEVVRFLEREVPSKFNRKLAAMIAVAGLATGSGLTALFTHKDAKPWETSSTSPISGAQVPLGPARPVHK